MSPTHHHDTTIEVDPDVPLVRIVREFDAPPAKVFRAHTDPELLVQWLGPKDITMVVDHFDCRTGGAYRYVHRRGDDEFSGATHSTCPSKPRVNGQGAYSLVDTCSDAIGRYGILSPNVGKYRQGLPTR